MSIHKQRSLHPLKLSSTCQILSSKCKQKKDTLDVADEINEEMFIAAQIRDHKPEVLQAPMKVFVIHMETVEIMFHGSKQNLASFREKKYVGTGQKKNLPLSICNRFFS